MASLGIIANYTHTLSTHISMCLHEHAAHLHQRVDWHRAAHVQLTSMLKQHVLVDMLIKIFFYSSVGSADKRNVFAVDCKLCQLTRMKTRYC